MREGSQYSVRCSSLWESGGDASAKEERVRRAAAYVGVKTWVPLDDSVGDYRDYVFW